jgi:hypothetical protein
MGRWGLPTPTAEDLIAFLELTHLVIAVTDISRVGSILTLAEMGKCHGRKHGCKVLPKKVGVMPEISRWPFVE